jgi:hypothetical protein
MGVDVDGKYRNFSSTLSKILVFSISGIAHEYILGVSLGFIFPVLGFPFFFVFFPPFFPPNFFIHFFPLLAHSPSFSHYIPPGLFFVFCASPLISISHFIHVNFGARAANFFMWVNFLLGNGLLTVLYAREFHLRYHEPPPNLMGDDWLYHG